MTGRSRSGLFWEQEGAGEAGGGWVRSQWESTRGEEAHRPGPGGHSEGFPPECGGSHRGL